MKEEIRTGAAPPPAGPYSQGMRAGNLVFTAGQGPFDPAARELVGDTIEEQTEAVIDNLSAVLAAAGTDLGHAVKAVVYLSDLSHFEAFNRVYERRFPDPRPARTTVASGLPPGVLVKIDLVAEMPSQAG